jgi:hypothetical protein
MVALSPERGIPVMDLRDELTVFHDLSNPNRWQGPFRESLGRWKTADGEVIVRALQDAQANPVDRPLSRRAMRRIKPIANDEVPASIPADSASDAPVETGLACGCRKPHPRHTTR